MAGSAVITMLQRLRSAQPLTNGIDISISVPYRADGGFPGSGAFYDHRTLRGIVSEATTVVVVHDDTNDRKEFEDHTAGRAERGKCLQQRHGDDVGDAGQPVPCFSTPDAL